MPSMKSVIQTIIVILVVTYVLETITTTEFKTVGEGEEARDVLVRKWF